MTETVSPQQGSATGAGAQQASGAGSQQTGSGSQQTGSGSQQTGSGGAARRCVLCFQSGEQTTTALVSLQLGEQSASTAARLGSLHRRKRCGNHQRDGGDAADQTLIHLNLPRFSECSVRSEFAQMTKSPNPGASYRAVGNTPTVARSSSFVDRKLSSYVVCEAFADRLVSIVTLTVGKRLSIGAERFRVGRAKRKSTKE